MRSTSSHPTRIRLEGDGRERVLRSLTRFFDSEIDVQLSGFQAERVLDFVVKELGPAVYNQAIGDARGFVQDKLADLDAEFFEPEEPYSG
jgi:uncharacterized protein (DUF2164 family)